MLKDEEEWKLESFENYMKLCRWRGHGASTDSSKQGTWCSCGIRDKIVEVTILLSPLRIFHQCEINYKNKIALSNYFSNAPD